MAQFCVSHDILAYAKQREYMSEIASNHLNAETKAQIHVSRLVSSPNI
jgi:hypothetical protein